MASEQSPLATLVDTRCVLCQDHFGTTNLYGFVESPVVTYCGHIFGSHCLKIWTNSSNSCPSCREPQRHPHRNCNHEIEARPLSSAPENTPLAFGSVCALCPQCEANQVTAGEREVAEREGRLDSGKEKIAHSRAYYGTYPDSEINAVEELVRTETAWLANHKPQVEQARRNRLQRRAQVW